MVSRGRVAGMRLLWLQDLVNVFPGLREVLYSELDRLNQLIQQYLPVQQEAQIWAFPGGVWEEAVRSACSKQEVKHAGLTKNLCFKHQLACLS